MNIRELQAAVHQNAVDKGWYENSVLPPSDPTWIGARLALVHSEVSEALECVREGMLSQIFQDAGGHTWSAVASVDGRDKPEGLPSELADIIIRVLDIAESLNIDMQTACELKHAYNQTRPRRHGGKAL